jgi:hypothetical protein
VLTRYGAPVAVIVPVGDVSDLQKSLPLAIPKRQKRSRRGPR